MKTTLTILLILVLAALIPVSCGENTTDPDDDGSPPVVYGGLLYDYEVETGNARTATVSPALGGTVRATGSNSRCRPSSPSLSPPAGWTAS